VKTHNKYWASIEISIRHQLTQRGQLLGRLFLYLVIVYLFHQVFQSVGAPPERLWYVAITEWLILSTPPLAFQVSEDINSGQMAYFILRPMDYLQLRLSECLGTVIVRFGILAVFCMGLGYTLSGFFPGDALTWTVGMVLGFCAVFLYNCVLTLIGLCTFWLKDIKTLLYLNLTATFCFGGLIVPLSFYSDKFRTFSFCTPYPWILWGPAEYITEGSLNLGYAALGWGFWMMVFSTLIILLYRQGLKHFVIEGG
jgi:ABC-2 type transport system permease protein